MEDFVVIVVHYQGSGDPMDLHEHPNGPLDRPCKADFRDPLVKKGPPGSFHGPN